MDLIQKALNKSNQYQIKWIVNDSFLESGD